MKTKKAKKKKEEILIEVHPSIPRRLFVLSSLVVLGLFAIHFALVRSEAELGPKLATLAFGIAVLWVADRVRQATSGSLQLTKDTLRHSSGEVLTTVDNIRSLDRGVFAYKPSSGFLLRLTERGVRRWEVGLWWCTGRWVGVGGVVSAPQAKAMAELLALMIAERDAAITDQTKTPRS
ncbi:hypothetical protein KUD11_08460 [Roseovarius sp. LXJ103]|uniref:hypothetical protein n=1 Tax=Roseovarius carneus TaxID=2853164 RepID=UPI000D622B14|nr:hypothetical protein [Roseovarius carneus]MBZ8118680.1 hypothetical protein [Roseovarius carneus]PWE35638.1 hypothetical protein DD563_06500 [Pelagicola sp. LXJ1103]